MRTSQNRKTTIDEVARQAGVSKTTVSRYLNGKYDNLSQETRERIRGVIEALDYRPNRMAQGLKARNTRLIGCLISDVSSPFSAYILKGINDVCEEAGYQVLFANSDDDPDRERSAIEGLLESQVDGLIVNTTGENDDWLVSLHEGGMPMVLADRCLAEPGKLDTVTTDNYDSSYACVRFLKEAGYTQVAFFTQGNKRINPRVKRYQGYCDAMRDFYGRSGADGLYQFSLEDPESCGKMITAYRSRYPGERLAVLTVNGVTMLRLLHGIQDLGVTMGREFGVCGFDDWGWASLIPPGITTISQDSWLVGSESAKIMLERINGTAPEGVAYVEIPNRLDIRGSVVRDKG